MKHIFLFFGITIGIFLHGMSQDTLIYKTGDRELVTVLEADSHIIKYQKWPAADDNKIYHTSGEIIDVLIYTSGERIILSPKTIPPVPNNAVGKGNHFISVDLYDMAYAGLITLSYQQIINKAHRIAIRIPISVSPSYLRNNLYTLNKGATYYNRNKIFSTGIDILQYVSPTGINGFVHGPSLEVGSGQYKFTYIEGNALETNLLWGAFYRLGYHMNEIKYVSFAIYTDVGISSGGYKRINVTSYEKATRLQGRLKVLVGFTF